MKSSKTAKIAIIAFSLFFANFGSVPAQSRSGAMAQPLRSDSGSINNVSTQARRPRPDSGVAMSNVSASWRLLDKGLEFAKFGSPHYAGDSGVAINILRISAKHYELRLMNAGNSSDKEMRTALGWAQKEGMVAVINAAMYQTDYIKSVSYMKTSSYVNNPRLSKDKTILLFEPLQKNILPARVVDTECDDFEKIGRAYGSAVQSIRMISCVGKNVWQQSDNRYSIVAFGMDISGNMLFIQCSAAHSVYEFINVLRKLPISIDRAMYMEGGSPSQMCVNAKGFTAEFIGEYTVGGKPTAATAIPNALGIRKIVAP